MMWLLLVLQFLLVFDLLQLQVSIVKFLLRRGVPRICMAGQGYLYWVIDVWRDVGGREDVVGDFRSTLCEVGF